MSNHHPPALTPTPKPRRSFTARKKLEVLAYWATPSIPYEWDPTELRRPTIREVSDFFDGIPVGCISAWRRIEAQIDVAATKEVEAERRGVLEVEGRRRRVTCSRCMCQGHNRNNRNCPQWAE